MTFSLEQVYSHSGFQQPAHKSRVKELYDYCLYHSLMAHQQQKGYTVPKQVIRSATPVNSSRYSLRKELYELYFAGPAK